MICHRTYVWKVSPAVAPTHSIGDRHLPTRPVGAGRLGRQASSTLRLCEDATLSGALDLSPCSKSMPFLPLRLGASPPPTAHLRPAAKVLR